MNLNFEQKFYSNERKVNNSFFQFVRKMLSLNSGFNQNDNCTELCSWDFCNYRKVGNCTSLIK